MATPSAEKAYEAVWQSTSHNSLPLFKAWAEQSNTTIFAIIQLAEKFRQNGQKFSLKAAHVTCITEDIPAWVLDVPGGSCTLFAVKVMKLAPPELKPRFWDNGTHRIATIGNSVIDSSARGVATWNRLVAEFGDFRYEKANEDGKDIIRSTMARNRQEANMTFREILPGGSFQAAVRLSMNQLGNEDILLVLFRYTKTSKERENRLGYWGKVTWNLSERTLEWSAPRTSKRGFVSQKVRFGGGSQEDKLQFSRLLELFLAETMPNGIKRLTQFEAQIGETHDLLWIAAVRVWGNPIKA